MKYLLDTNIWIWIVESHQSIPLKFFYLLGLLSKEMAITLPAIILLYDLMLRDANRTGK
jgi:PIN domain nuclease of toxin-antitoxin system